FRLGRAGVVDVLDVELLARCVGVIAAGGDGGPGDSIALRGERARAVDHRVGSAKRGNQAVVVGKVGDAGLRAGQAGCGVGEAVRIASDEDEVGAETGQFGKDEPALVAVRSVDCNFHGFNV